MKKILALLFALLATPAGAQTIPSGAWGSINYWGVGGLSQVLAPGLAGQCLTSQNVGSAPIWVNCQVSSLSLLPPISANSIMANNTLNFVAPQAIDVNRVLDMVGYDIIRPPVPESIIYKSNVGPNFNWQTLPPGTAGSLLASGGPTNPIFWAPSAAAGNLASICQTVGAMLYFDTPSLLWKCLNPGTSGQLLQTGGAAGNPSWLTVTLATLGGVPSTRSINTSAPLGGGAALSSDLTLTCATCVTSSGGGAITGTAPVVVSAAGNVSLANNGVGNGLLATAAAYTVKCNPTGATAAEQDCTQAQVMPFVGPFVTPQNYNASGSGSSTTGTISSGSPTLTLAAAIDFANTQGIRINHAGAAFAGTQPSALVVTPTGTPGATNYAYTLACLDANGGVGQSIANVATTTGNATLSSTNYNALAWAAGSGCTTYAVYGNHTGSLALIAVVNTTSYNDMGVESFTVPDFIPTAPQTSAALADWLVTTITSGGGTTTLTLAANAGTAATTQFVIHDDTASLQSWINAAQATGQEAFLPTGSYQVSTALNITSRLKIQGTGYQGDSGAFYGNNGYAIVTSTSGWQGSTIVAVPSTNVFVATTNKAITIEDIQILYPTGSFGWNGSASWPGRTAITIQSVAGAGNANVGSSIKNVLVIGADTAVVMNNDLSFLIDNLFTIDTWSYSIVVQGTNYPSFGDSTITRSTLGGCCNNVALLPQGYQAGVLVTAGAGLRLVNNKFNYGNSASTSQVLINPSTNGQNVVPLIIANNSIEGGSNGIAFVLGNAGASIALVSITGNEIWSGFSSIRVNTSGATQWLKAATISGNILQVNGGAGVTSMTLDNLGSATIGPNTFSCSGGCSASTGMVLGANTTGLSVNGNVYDAGYTTKISNLAASGLNSQTDVACPPIPKVFTSGTNSTFTLDKCVGNLPQYLEMEMVGGGGGGAGSGTTPGAATAGGATCWNTSSPACTTPIYQTGGGALGTVTPGNQVAGGTVSGSGTCDDAIAGASATSGSNQPNGFGGYGGSSPYGGAGPAAFSGVTTGGAAAANSGSGGGGAGYNATANAGGGGAAGAWCRVKIGSLAASYFYTIAAAGAAGTAGTGGNAGGAGGAGRLKAMERWQ